ncbi:MAG: flagellar hook-associated protein FlgK [Deltaproteobacteria bacterium]|nr:flagellar hook-associated protein FlgK [Deltaproteobacteria bacterium]
MGSLTAILSAARDGIIAQSGGINVTAQNIAGANTPGFVKRTAVLESLPTGGVALTGVKRSFDRFTYSQLIDQEGKLASARVRSTALSDLESIVSPAVDHIGDRADALFDALQELSLYPSDNAVRSTVLARAEWLGASFSETAAGLDQYREELFTRVRDLTTEVNQRLDSLSSVDASVRAALARGEDASDLVDRRDQLVREIGERVGGRVVEDERGGLTLFGAGTVLYENGHAAKLSASLDSSNDLSIRADRDGNVIDITKSIDAGALAGAKIARDVDIPDVLASLDAFAKDLTDTINAVHVTGYGLDGVAGRPLFTPSATVAGAANAMSVDPSIAGHPERIATSSSAGSLPGGNDVAAALADLVRKNLNTTGGTTSERYAAIASKVGMLRNVASGEESMREDTVATATALRESASGVSTDEEMINLQRFQRAFEASSRVLRTVDELYQTLLQSIG